MTRLVLVFPVLAACAADPTTSREGPDAAAGSADAVTPQTPTCADESFQLQGAVDLVTTSSSTVTVNGKVVGVAGSSGPNRLYSLNVRLSTGGMLDTVGTYDVSTLTLQYLDQPYGGCSAGACVGFFAMAGTFEVLELAPMYRATFTLRDLHERADADSSPGAPIAGDITGCASAFN